MNEPIYDARTFWELLERRVELSADKKMLIDDSDRSLTFSEVKEKAEKTAAGLEQLGVREGTPVTWVLPTRIETIVTSLALSRLGAVQNPIIHIYREKEVGFCIRQTNAEIVLVPGEWNGFNYQEMVKNSTVDMDNPPEIIEIYDSLPEAEGTELSEEISKFIEDRKALAQEKISYKENVGKHSAKLESFIPVSYTHLTLPTICSV